MASIKSAKKRKRENGKIYVSGYVDGLETGYNYCIMYSYNDGPMKNMGHGGMSYTFISLASLPKGSSKRYSFSESGSWVTDEGDGTYKIICNMVGGRCEDVHVQESSRSFSVAAPYTPPTPPPPTCDEGAIVCEYNEAEGRYMLKKCVNGKLVYEKWCGASDTCEGGVCVPPAGVTPPTPPTPTCDEGAIVCEYNEAEGRYMLKKCVNGKLVYEKWCGASDTCEGGVCVPPAGVTPPTPPTPHGAVPIVTPTTEKKYLSRDEATVRINAGLPCYIKCVLPVLDTLPGIPYTPGAWVPPLCAITTTA
ncbi:MAG: hypothetical protein J7K40_13735 [candidate division Zixibacteria bacterium]|nr:hypothetical protein [candidate division Zixibacteria bacterium]